MDCYTVEGMDDKTPAWASTARHHFKVALHNHVVLSRADHHLDWTTSPGREVNNEPSRSTCDEVGVRREYRSLFRMNALCHRSAALGRISAIKLIPQASIGDTISRGRIEPSVEEIMYANRTTLENSCLAIHIHSTTIGPVCSGA